MAQHSLLRNPNSEELRMVHNATYVLDHFDEEGFYDGTSICTDTKPDTTDGSFEFAPIEYQGPFTRCARCEDCRSEG